MKTETRQVTETKTVYIADDGREFYNEDDCEAYDMVLMEKSLKFYDSKFEPSDLEHCTYVNLHSEAGVETMLALCKYHGVAYDGISTPGVYMYHQSYNGDTWTNLGEKLAAIQNKEE